MARVTLKNVWKKYREVEAVKRLNLTCEDKEFLCLLGPSGCGKTSILRMIAGLEEVTEGDIYIDDVRVNDVDPSRRDIAMVFENYALYPHKTVFQNMAYPLRIRKEPPEEVEKKVKAAAELLRIQELSDRYPRELSGGQRQRVGVGRAIVRNPKVFLMDEPISHLDTKLREHMRGEMKRLQKKLDQTFIYVTHDQIEAMTMADRIAVINFGVLQQVGTPTEIFYHPVNEFVAGFVGSPPMNFLKCDLIAKSGEWKVKHKLFEIPLSGEVNNAIKGKLREFSGSYPGKLGFRPHFANVSLKKQKPDSIKAEIYLLEPLGTELIAHLLVGEDRVRVVTSPDFEANIGDTAYIDLDTKKIHIFDEQTTRSLI